MDGRQNSPKDTERVRKKKTSVDEGGGKRRTDEAWHGSYVVSCGFIH